MSTSRKNTLILSFTLLVVMLGYGMVLPVMPFYIEQLGAGGSELGWLMSTYSLMQLIFAPLWGMLSDRVGRKPVISIGILGYSISLLMFGLATQFWMLFLARTLSGILSSATLPTAMAYIGDNTPEQERGGRMGQLGAAMGIGVVLGPLLGGWLSTDTLSLPFFIGAGMAFLALLLVLIFLPESRSPQAEAGKKMGLTRANIRTIFFSPAGVLLLLVFVMSFGLANFQGMIGLYVVDKFAFNTRQVGAIWMVLGGVMIVAQGVLTGPLTQKLGDVTVIRIGLLGSVIGFVFILLANGYITILLAIGALVLSLALIGPALNAYLSVFAGERQGAVMGLNSAASSLGRVAGPLWAGYLYDLDLAYPFISGAASLMVGLVVSLLGLRTHPAGTSKAQQKMIKDEPQ
jgi:DHA1 family multidrug resistance protein-like MFS transporter